MSYFYFTNGFYNQSYVDYMANKSDLLNMLENEAKAGNLDYNPTIKYGLINPAAKSEKIKFLLSDVSDDRYRMQFTCVDSPEKYKNCSNLTELMIISVIVPEVSCLLNDKRFMNEFYNTYMKLYINKMAKTVKNYTVESYDIPTLIIPFETGWYKYSRSFEFTELIDKLCMNIIYALNNKKIMFAGANSDGNLKNLSLTLYKLLMAPSYSCEKIAKTFDLERSYSYDSSNEISMGTLFDNYDYPDLMKFDRYSSNVCYTLLNNNLITEEELKGKKPINFVKRIIRYILVHQIKQAMCSYLIKRKAHDEDLNSIFADIDLYFTHNLSLLTSNATYYENILREYNQLMDRPDEMDNKVIDRLDNAFVTKYLSNQTFLIALTKKNASGLKDVMQSRNENGLYTKKSADMLAELIIPVFEESKKIVNNVYSFTFTNHWNDIIKDNTILIPKKYISDVSGGIF